MPIIFLKSNQNDMPMIFSKNLRMPFRFATKDLLKNISRGLGPFFLILKRVNNKHASNETVALPIIFFVSLKLMEQTMHKLSFKTVHPYQS